MIILYFPLWRFPYEKHLLSNSRGRLQLKAFYERKPITDMSRHKVIEEGFNETFLMHVQFKMNDSVLGFMEKYI